jgi:DNA-binding response OmpR family regulator
MDLRTRRVGGDGHEVQLTAGEFEVPANLMRDPDQVPSRELILNAVPGFESTRGPRCLEVSEIEAPVRCSLQGR